MQRANRFIVKQIRAGVFPHFHVIDQDAPELPPVDDGADRAELQDLADAMNSLNRQYNGGVILCQYCGSSREHVEMMALVAGITDPICCEGLC